MIHHHLKKNLGTCGGEGPFETQICFMGGFDDGTASEREGGCLGVQRYIFLTGRQLPVQELLEAPYIGHQSFIGLFGGGFSCLCVNGETLFIIMLEDITPNVEPDGCLQVSNIFENTQLVECPLNIKTITPIIEKLNGVIGCLYGLHIAVNHIGTANIMVQKTLSKVRKAVLGQRCVSA